MREPAYRFCNLILAWCYKRIDPQKREEWEYMLEEPLPGDIERFPTKDELRAETAAFIREASAIAGG